MLARICRNDFVGLAGERMGAVSSPSPNSSALVAATSDLRDSCAGCCAVRMIIVGLPPRLRLWEGGRQVGARSTGDQQYGGQPERRREGDPAQQDTSQ